MPFTYADYNYSAYLIIILSEYAVTDCMHCFVACMNVYYFVCTFCLSQYFVSICSVV